MRYNAPDDVKLIKYCDVMVNLDDLKNIPNMKKKDVDIYKKKKELMLEKILPDVLKYIENQKMSVESLY